MNGVYDAPQLCQAVLHWRSSECDAKVSVHRLCRISKSDARRLYFLRFVEQQNGKPYLPEVTVVVAQGLIGREDPVGSPNCLHIQGGAAVAGIIAKRAQPGTVGAQALSKAR